MIGNYSGFAETPSSVVLEVENGVERAAVFRCRHQRIDAEIGWLINGSSFRVYRDVMDGSYQDDDGRRVDTLTIPAISVYNRSEVVCVATFFDGSPLEVTPSATLIITGVLAIHLNEMYIIFNSWLHTSSRLTLCLYLVTHTA